MKPTIELCTSDLNMPLLLKSFQCAKERDMMNAILERVDGQTEGHWHFLGGNEKLSGITGAQQKNKEAAAKELISNAFDSILSRAIAQIYPDPLALSADNAQAWQIAAAAGLMPAYGSIVAFTYGQAGCDDVCFGVADRGAGQRPEFFPRSFLGICDSGKRSFPWLFGFFGMGSTGVHAFSGVHGIKLIVSRSDEPDCPWGFTFVRRKPGTLGTLEYFAPEGKIMTVPAQDLLPLMDKAGEPWAGSSSDKDAGVFSHGSIVKMFSFEKLRHIDSTFDSVQAMVNQRFSRLPFPVMCFHSLNGGHYTLRRDAKGQPDSANGADVRKAVGMFAVAQEASEKDSAKDDYIAAIDVPIDFPDLASVSVKVHAALFPVDPDKAKPAHKKIGKHVAMHTLSGQAHFMETSGFLTEAGLAILDGRVFIHIDASGLGNAVSSQVFGSDRDSIFDNTCGRFYKERVLAAISGSPTIAQWAADEQERRSKAALETADAGINDKINSWCRSANASMAMGRKGELERRKLDARMTRAGDDPADGMPAGYSELKAGFDSLIQKQESSKTEASKGARAPSSGSAPAPKNAKRIGGTRSAPASASTRRAAKHIAQARKAAPAAEIGELLGIAKASVRREGAAEVDLPLDMFKISGVEMRGEELFASFALANPDDFALVEGGEVVFDLSVSGGSITIDGLSTVWVKASEETEIDALGLSGRAKRGAGSLFLFSKGTRDGRALENGSKTEKIDPDFEHAAYEPRILGAKIQIVWNLDHPQAKIQAEEGKLDLFHDAIAQNVVAFCNATLSAKRAVAAISPLFSEGKKIDDSSRQLEAVKISLAPMAAAADQMALVAMSYAEDYAQRKKNA